MRFAAVIAVALLLVGCGSDDPSGPPPVEVSTISRGNEGWRVVNIDGLLCVERSWEGYSGTEYSISCVDAH